MDLSTANKATVLPGINSPVSIGTENRSIGGVETVTAFSQTGIASSQARIFSRKFTERSLFHKP